MRWIKGKTSQEKHIEDLIKKRKWHEWFAWYPVTIDVERAWLEVVLRKGEPNGVRENGTIFLEYEYKEREHIQFDTHKR
jgi:hypothetical protein